MASVSSPKDREEGKDRKRRRRRKRTEKRDEGKEKGVKKKGDVWEEEAERGAQPPHLTHLGGII